MTELISDALIAAVTVLDRGFTAAQNVLRLRFSSPGTVDGAAPPAGVGLASAGPNTGGHPVRATSELLTHAAGELHHVYGGNIPAVVAGLQSELRLRAAEFAAFGD